MGVMYIVVSWITDTGVKDTPFLGSVWGAKEAEERLLPGGFVNARDLRAS